MSPKQADKTPAPRPSSTQWLELEFTSKGLRYHLEDPTRDSSNVVASFEEELGDLKTMLFGDRPVDLRNINKKDLENVTPFGKRVLYRKVKIEEEKEKEIVILAVYFAKGARCLSDLKDDDLDKRSAAMKKLESVFAEITKVAEKHT